MAGKTIHPVSGIFDSDSGKLIGFVGRDGKEYALAGAEMIDPRGAAIDYGIDLLGSANPLYAGGAAPFTPAKAHIRTSDEVCWISGAGVPVDYTDGDPVATGEGYAAIGSLYTDTTNGNLYINGGTKAQPTWKLVTRAA